MRISSTLNQIALAPLNVAPKLANQDEQPEVCHYLLDNMPSEGLIVLIYLAVGVSAVCTLLILRRKGGASDAFGFLNYLVCDASIGLIWFAMFFWPAFILVAVVLYRNGLKSKSVRVEAKCDSNEKSSHAKRPNKGVTNSPASGAR